MQRLRHLRSIVAFDIGQRQSCKTILDRIRYESVSSGLRTLSATASTHKRESIAKPLRSTKPKSKNNTLQYFVDIKPVRALFHGIIIPIHERAIVFSLGENSWRKRWRRADIVLTIVGQ